MPGSAPRASRKVASLITRQCRLAGLAERALRPSAIGTLDIEMSSRDNFAATRFALAHPVQASVFVGSVGGGWAGFLFHSARYGLIWSVVLFTANLLLWMKPFGPLRRYSERYQGDS